MTVWHLLVRERNWPPARYEQWLHEGVPPAPARHDTASLMASEPAAASLDFGSQETQRTCSRKLCTSPAIRTSTWMVAGVNSHESRLNPGKVVG